MTTTGTKYLSLDAATAAAKSDLEIAYNDAVGRTPATPITTDLGNLTLNEGVYNSPSSIGISGPLTLDGRNNAGAVFIFQAGSTLTTANASSVILINGAQPCNVFWQVGSSASFGMSSAFVGHVLALESITAGNGTTFEGQLLARNGAVTLNTNSIINDGCEPVVLATPPPAAPAVAPPAAVPPAAVPPAAAQNVPPVSVQNPAVANPPVAKPVVPPVLIATDLPPAPVSATEIAGQLPDTDAPGWPLPLVLGLALMALGLASFLLRRRIS